MSSRKFSSVTMGYRLHGGVAGAAVFLLSACGGGGGGTAEPVVQPLVITASSAPAAAADALAAVEGGAAEAGGALDLLKSYSPQRTLTAHPRTVLGSVMALVPLGAPATGLKASFSEAAACEGGGTLTVQGSIVDPDAGLAAGDQVLMAGSNCRYVDGGVSYVMDGSIRITVLAGFVPVAEVYPVNATVSLEATGFRLQAGSESLSTTGDMRLEMAASGPTTETLVATGNAWSYTFILEGHSPRTVTWRAYRQSVSVAGPLLTLDVAGQIESQGGPLGSTAFSYALTTPEPLVASTASGEIGAGRLRVNGQGSVMDLRFTGPGLLSLDLDLNGDGVFEQSSATTQAELEARF